AGLSNECLKNPRMAVALVQGRIRADAIEVLAALDIPSEYAFSARDDHGERRVVARADPLGPSNDTVRFSHSVYFVVSPLRRARICSPNRLSTSSTASSAVRLRSSNAGLSSMISSERIRPESWIISMQSCASR